MKKRICNKICSLKISDKQVVLTIESDDEKAIEIISLDVKEPRVMAPLPNLKRLKDNAKYFSNEGLWGGTEKGFFEEYIRGRKEDINNQILEIRKSIKRIERSIICIDIVKKHINGIG